MKVKQSIYPEAEIWERFKRAAHKENMSANAKICDLMIAYINLKKARKKK